MKSVSMSMARRELAKMRAHVEANSMLPRYIARCIRCAETGEGENRDRENGRDFARLYAEMPPAVRVRAAGWLSRVL